MMKRYSVVNIKITDDYLLVRGDFGDYLTKNFNKEEFYTPVPGRKINKKLPDPEDVKTEDVGKAGAVIFKRNLEQVHTIAPLRTTSSFLNRDKDGKYSLLVSVIEKKDEKKILQMITYEIYDDFKLHIVEDIGSTVMRLQIALKTIDDAPYNTQIATLMLDRDYAIENTNMLGFLFFIFAFCIAVAIYSYRWWVSNT